MPLDGQDTIGSAVVVPLAPKDYTALGWLKAIWTALAGGTAGTPSTIVLTVQSPEDAVTLTKAAVTFSGGVSQSLVSALATRKIVVVSSSTGNASATVDPTGGIAALTAGIPLEGGDTLTFTGKTAQSAMTCIGTPTQLLTVYTG